ncbi:MAG TPA: hypothetical protein VKT49_06460 [Bryobacteraceae bacterium]|nr:hypothetical protein [Bryobacteraceae bacterium]
MKLHPFTFVIAGLALAGSGALAAVFPRITAEELTAQSQVIVEGNIVRSWAAWDPDHKYIWTHYEISVRDQLRGARSATVTISEPGGSLDGVNQQFSGAVSYATGENAVFFLYQTPIGYWRSVGGPQGKFTVDREGRVHSHADSAAFLENPGRAGTPLSSWEGLRLGDFKIRVRRQAAANPFRGRR